MKFLQMYCLTLYIVLHVYGMYVLVRGFSA